MSESSQKAGIEARELIAGALLFLAGGTGAFQALEFDSESRMFPLFVAVLLGLTGVAIVGHAILKPAKTGERGSKFGGVVLAALLIAAWAMAFAGGAGFVLPTFALQASLLWLTGLRRPVYIAIVAALVTALAYLLFVVLLDIPLPPTRLPAALQGF